MRINSSCTYEERGLDAYWTPIEAVHPLIKLENLPQHIWEPACGEGAIVQPLIDAGYNVTWSDIRNYGFRQTMCFDFLTAPKNFISIAEGIVTNPPFKLAQQFAEKALSEVDYLALYLRLNWLEGSRRQPFFEKSRLSRVRVSSRRLPMMHRYGWEGNKIGSSNIAFAWFIWDHRQGKDYTDMEMCTRPHLSWFDWKDFVTDT